MIIAEPHTSKESVNRHKFDSRNLVSLTGEGEGVFVAGKMEMEGDANC